MQANGGRVNPSWVITILPDEGELSNDSFGKTIEQQIAVWSNLNGIQDRWWTVNALNGDPNESLDNFATVLQSFLRHPWSHEDGDKALIDGARTQNLNIFLIGDIRSARTRQFFNCLAKLLRVQALPQPLLQGRNPFLNWSVSVRGLIYFPLQTAAGEFESVFRFFTQLQTLMSDDFIARRPFESLFVFQERNLDEENPGYTKLSDSKINELMVQSLFHLMIGGAPALEQLKQTHNSAYIAMGAASVYYDWKAAQRCLAQALGEDLMTKFALANASPFVNAEEARSTSKDLGSRFSAKTLYERLILGGRRPKLTFNARLWDGARNSRGKRVSAWALYSKLLLLVYFQSFLKRLPYRISEYSRAFLYSLTERLGCFLTEQREVIWTGGEAGPESGLHEALRELMSEVLKGERGSARTLRQLALVADEIKAVYDPARLDTQLGSVSNQSRLDVLAVPDFLRVHYEQAQDKLTPDDEENLYRRLVEAVQAHPMPTALFLNAILIGILLALVGIRFLTLLSPSVINLEPLLAYPLLTYAVLFGLPLVFAFWRYHFRTLKQLQKELLTYMGSVLRHAQAHARELVRQELAILMGQVQGYCDEVKSLAEEFGYALSYPPTESEAYPSTTFQREVFAGFEIPGQTQQSPTANTPECLLPINESRKPFSEFDELEKNTYLRKLLDEVEDGQPLWEKIVAAIAAERPDGIVVEIERRWREYCEKLYRDVEQKQVDSLLETNTFVTMKRLAFPPLNLQAGVPKHSVVTEWKFGKAELLARFPADTTESISGMTTLASLAAYRPIEELADISILRNVIQNIAIHSLQWDDLPSLFTAATTAVKDSPEYNLVSLANEQDMISLEDMREQIANLENRFGIRTNEIHHQPVQDDSAENEDTDSEVEI